MPAGYALYEVPELEETEFALSISTCPRIEDANDGGYLGGSFSIAAGASDELPQIDE